ncbi:hypothetical protein EXIGLDRAFT_707758 [Exidia glandulosa HHB12029]|uniref:Uncharacterized protein n=1 Tax=Exidia glandulosa HHB12029 TaxID=1314781 RepID=A0A166NFN9_EXIGL|nr:hypothetical protein EXIGLDRAFT_707758 [Exidia glandulosa HHB12029]
MCPGLKTESGHPLHAPESRWLLMVLLALGIKIVLAREVTAEERDDPLLRTSTNQLPKRAIWESSVITDANHPMRGKKFILYDNLMSNCQDVRTLRIFTGVLKPRPDERHLPRASDAFPRPNLRTSRRVKTTDAATSDPAAQQGASTTPTTSPSRRRGGRATERAPPRSGSRRQPTRSTRKDAPKRASTSKASTSNTVRRSTRGTKAKKSAPTVVDSSEEEAEEGPESEEEEEDEWEEEDGDDNDIDGDAGRDPEDEDEGDGDAAGGEGAGNGEDSTMDDGGAPDPHAGGDDDVPPPPTAPVDPKGKGKAKAAAPEEERQEAEPEEEQEGEAPPEDEDSAFFKNKSIRKTAGATTKAPAPPKGNKMEVVIPARSSIPVPAQPSTPPPADESESTDGDAPETPTPKPGGRRPKSKKFENLPPRDLPSRTHTPNRRMGSPKRAVTPTPAPPAAATASKKRKRALQAEDNDKDLGEGPSSKRQKSVSFAPEAVISEELIALARKILSFLELEIAVLSTGLELCNPLLSSGDHPGHI